MSLIDKIGSFFTGSDIVKSIGDIADEYITTDAEKEQFKLEAQKVIFEHEQKIKESIVKEYELEVQDRSSARDMNAKVNESVNASWLSKNVAPMIALGVIILTFIMFFTVLFINIPTDKKETVTYLLGGLISITTSIIGFYFGSSIGSKEKTQQLMDRK